MPVTIEIIKPADQPTTEWTGGTSTQLAIYPRDSSLAQRSFRWRLSTATVAMEESTFTALPGFQRILMLISCHIRIVHEAHHERMLAPFDLDRFDGAWTTRSYGRCTDFNLMMAAGVEVSLRPMRLEAGECAGLALGEMPGNGKRRKISAIYLTSGDMILRDPDDRYPLRAKDCALIHPGEGPTPRVSLDCPMEGAPCQAILAEITY